MRKIFLFIGIISIAMFSCKPKDTRGPVIYLEGDTILKVTLGRAYIEPGYLAQDNVSGNVTSAVSVTTDMPTTSSTLDGLTTKAQDDPFYITYTVQDKEGNQGTNKRTIYVINSAKKFCTDYFVDKTQQDNSTSASMFPNYTQKSMAVRYDKKTNFRITFGRLCNEVNGIYGDIKRTYKTEMFINGLDTTYITVSDSIYILIEPQEKEANGYIYKIRGKNSACYFTDTLNHQFKIEYQIDQHYINTDGTIGLRKATDDIKEIYTKQ